MFQVAFFISYLSAITILLPCIGFVVFIKRAWKESLNTDIFYASIYILFIMLAQVLILIYSLNRIPNYIFFNVFYPFEFAIFIFIILQWFDEVKLFKTAISIAVFLLSYLLIYVTESWNEFPFMLVLIESAVLIPLSFNSTIRMARKTFDSYRLAMFKGILFCCLGNLVMVGFIKTSLNEASIIQSVLSAYANYLFMKSFFAYQGKIWIQNQ